MRELIKKYWDILGGVFTGFMLSALAKFKLDKVQLVYSIIILILVSIGVFKIIKQSVDKNKNKRKETIIDSLVDGQKPVKAISLATSPTREGEKLGSLLIETLQGGKKVMNKLKVFFDKFKGYILTFLLGVLGLIEMVGGFLNDALQGALSIRGIEILPIITLVCALIVGILSNGYTKEQQDKIKALFSKSSTNELVVAEIRKTLKDDETKQKELNKILINKGNELGNLESQLDNFNNTYNAKVEMRGMTPQLATDQDVLIALTAVNETKEKIELKKAEIENVKQSISDLTITINALKSQL